MSRSNGNNGQAAPPPPQQVPQWRHPADPDPQAAWHHQPTAHGQHAPQQPQAQPPFYANQAPHQPSQAPYQPAFQPSHDLPPFGQEPPIGHAQPGFDPYHHHGQQQPAHTAPPLTSYVPQPPPQQWAPAPRGPDPQGFDLGDYSTGMTQRGQAPHAAQSYPATHIEPTFDSGPYAQPGQTRYGQQNQPQFAQEPAPVGAPRLATQPGNPLAAPQAAFRGVERPPPMAPAPQAQEAEEEYEDEEEFEDEPKRGGRKLMVVGALIGAICVGGGLAYTYKAFSGGKTPMLNANANGPKKAAPPTDNGIKIGAKLPDAVPQQSVASVVQETDGGPRKVQTITVTPPGGNTPTVAMPPPAPGQTGVPGMVIDMPAARPPLPPLVPVLPQPSNVPRAAAVPQLPAPQPKIAAVAPEQTPRKPAAVPVPKKATDAYSPSAVPGSTGGVTPPPAGATVKSALGAPPANTSGANGFVATVLSTPKGRPEAMKAFADLQQKYPDVLGTKPAEVQEKNLGAEKGIWYRAVVGPPGSREAASSVCTQLKASGYGQCFVSAY